MKNLFLLFFILFALTTFKVNSQTLYIPSGTGGIGSSSNSNVGIGISNPTEKFHVWGNLLLTGTLGFNNDISNYYIKGVSNGLQYSPYSIGNFTFNSGSGNWSFTNGNVGIGTTAALSKLNVNITQGAASGNTPRGLSISDISTTAGVLDIGIDASGTFYSWLQSRHYSTASFFNLALNPIGGNVGIGTTTPTSKLYVFNSSSGNDNQVIANLVRESTPTGGSNILRFGYHSTSDIELNSGYSSNGFRYGSYFDLNIVNNNTGGQYGGINFVTNSLNRLIIAANGNVGIGTTTPLVGLHVTKTIDYNGLPIAAIFGNNYYDWTQFGGLTAGRIRGSNEGYLVVEGNPKGTGDKSLYLNYSSNGNVIIATGGGNVGIGTHTPGNFKLAVEGTIGAREVKVTTVAWADFVFRPTYKLRTLGEVEQFIKTNNHLPEIPTEAEVKENGISIGEMNAKLLQKIEELTLYMIEMKKENEDLKNRVSELEKK